ncbi:uncharacterized protein [Hyperolius riggenbachi]|uniref:uncharacterized protein n=1 Tax=Hyperolius riggenbachi TaxID=752182 RepID=UPI0035A2A00B
MATYQSTIEEDDDSSSPSVRDSSLATPSDVTQTSVEQEEDDSPDEDILHSACSKWPNMKTSLIHFKDDKMRKMMEEYWSKFPPLDQDPSFYEKPSIARTSAEGPQDSTQQEPREQDNLAREIENLELDNTEHHEEQPIDFDWCECGGNCMAMPTLHESLCCNQVEAICEKFDENTSCVTQLPYFIGTFVNTESVENFYRFHPDVNGHPDDRLYNRQLRKTAYRTFTVWIYGYLGKGRRKAIPACVVKKIKEQFPDPEHLYTGFMFPHDYDASEMIDL